MVWIMCIFKKIFFSLKLTIIKEIVYRNSKSISTILLFLLI